MTTIAVRNSASRFGRDTSPLPVSAVEALSTGLLVPSIDPELSTPGPGASAALAASSTVGVLSTDNEASVATAGASCPTGESTAASVGWGDELVPDEHPAKSKVTLAATSEGRG